MTRRSENQADPEVRTKKKKPAKSAKWRLLLALILLTVVSIVFVWVAQSVFLDGIYNRIKKKEVKEAVSSLLALDDKDDFSEDITAFGKEQNLCIAAYLINPDHSVEYLAGYDAKPNCSCPLHKLQFRKGFVPGGGFVYKINDTAIRSAAESSLEKNGFCYVREETDKSGYDSSKDNLTAAGSAKNPDGSVTVFFVNSSLVPLGSTVETLNSMMFYLTVFVVIGAVIFALLISLWITKPIEEINSSAKRLAQCDYTVRFEGKGYKEIEELSDTLNYAASELSKTDLLQKELIANISHDLRTPLTLITGYAEAMRDLPDEMTEENLQIIIDESNRMKALVNDVLDISKLGSGTADIAHVPVPLTNSIESELTRYNKLRDREGYVIEFNYTEQVTVLGDHQRLMQVIYNLVNNAVNYAGQDKKIIVDQTVKKGRVRISITDHGEGIAEEELPKIWERYYKVDKTHKRATVGSGLGLSIVKGIVTAHGGTCGVSSKVGEGSTFWFELDVVSSVPIE